jgi:dipeptidyl aminopeptidase/acylaminoacyl peptidase
MRWSTICARRNKVVLPAINVRLGLLRQAVAFIPKEVPMQPALARLARLVLLPLLLCASLAARAGEAPLPPIDSFFDNPAFGGAALSPSGRYLAARSSRPGQHDFLAVIDLASHTAKVAAAFSDADIGHFEWVNDERLLFDLTDKATAQGDLGEAPGLFAVGRDGGKLVQLAERRGRRFVAEDSGLLRKELLPWHTFMLGQRGAQDSEFVYVRSAVYDNAGALHHIDLLRLNTLTGRAQAIPGPGPVRHWLLDQHGEPRVAVTEDEAGISSLYFRQSADGQWRKLASYNAYTDARNAVEPLGFGPDGKLYVTARTGSDTSAAHLFNLAENRIDPEPIVVTKGYDFDGELVSDQTRVLGVRFTTEAEENEWFDPGMKAVQQTVDKLLPRTINLISVPAHSQTSWVLVESYSDQMPPSFRLYDTKAGTLDKVADSYPNIDGARMGRQDWVRYKARDGLEIPALLTYPAGQVRKNLPLVVLVHGGPWLRGATWGWRPATQFLASRGYAVLEPAFRGSTGLGARHLMAGFKQWGLAMQNDIADGARWAIAQGIADAKRICIAGASYGGYATLMGLVNDPDLYRCGVEWAGVTDISLMYTGTWYGDSDLPNGYRTHGMPVMIGDPVKDAAQLKATSPLEQAARIHQPLLLAYGGADRRVPLFHGTRFRDAVRRTNPNVEWIEYPEEGHGWALPKNRIDFWSRVERFLDRQIGARRQP